MKKILQPLALLCCLILATGLASCGKDEPGTVSKKYAEWKEKNDRWLVEQQNRLDEHGNNYYTAVTAAWDPAAVVYMHWLNDRSLTQGNPQPYYTSTVDVKYTGKTYDGEEFDSSTYVTTPAVGVMRTKLTAVVEGWAIALTAMHVGDHCEVIVPYNVGYGSSAMNTIIPYSMLVFDIELVGIPKLERVQAHK